jgi:hypothetical protein
MTSTPRPPVFSLMISGKVNLIEPKYLHRARIRRTFRVVRVREVRWFDVSRPSELQSGEADARADGMNQERFIFLEKALRENRVVR